MLNTVLTEAEIYDFRLMVRDEDDHARHHANLDRAVFPFFARNIKVGSLTVPTVAAQTRVEIEVNMGVLNNPDQAVVQVFAKQGAFGDVDVSDDEIRRGRVGDFWWGDGISNFRFAGNGVGLMVNTLFITRDYASARRNFHDANTSGVSAVGAEAFPGGSITAVLAKQLSYSSALGGLLGYVTYQAADRGVFAVAGRLVLESAWLKMNQDDTSSVVFAVRNTHASNATAARLVKIAVLE